MMLTQQVNMQPCMKGFESINRYFDKKHKIIAAKLLPGEYYVTQQQEMITTVLGSCISVCIYDPVSKMGGMNHFMLPTSDSVSDSENLLSDSFRYGDVAMERLINDMLRHGSDKRMLVFKAFGGGQIIQQMTSIGERNIRFLRKFMMLEGFRMAAQDLGGIHPRKVNFFPASGKVMVKKLEHMHNDTIVQREDQYKNLVDAPDDISGDIDLFD